MKRALRWNKHRCVRGLGILLIMAILVAGMPGCRLQIIDPIEIWTWYDLHAISNNLTAHYLLMNDLDATTPGYEELAGPTANEGKGWSPIGIGKWPVFTGVFEGQGYEIRDLYINRPDTERVGLFSQMTHLAEIRNVRLVNASVTGGGIVGGLVGMMWRGIPTHGLTNCYFSGNVTGTRSVGGLVGDNANGTVSNSHATGSVTGTGSWVGGLVGYNRENGIVDDSYATGSVTGTNRVGGLVGENEGGTLSNSHAASSVTGTNHVGGLVGRSSGTVNDCYAAGSVTGTSSVGGLVGASSGTVSNSHATGTVTGGDYVGGLVGATSGTVQNTYATGTVTGGDYVGGLVGYNRLHGTVKDSHATGSVTGDQRVGGLAGCNGDWGTVSNSYATGSVTGTEDVGGLVGSSFGLHWSGRVSNSHYDYSEVLINGENVITIGALYHDDFEQWLANGRFLDVTERLYQEDGYYLINDVSDLKQLLAFGQDRSLRFRLKDDIDLGADPGFYIPYLAGEFDGNGHRISNLSFNSDFIADVGLFGHLAQESFQQVGRVSDLGVENVNIRGAARVGGLVGLSGGIVSNSYATGNMTGGDHVGGLVGYSSRHGTVRNSHATANVTGEHYIGGLVGYSHTYGIVENSYATGSVTGEWAVGGLVGWNDNLSTISNSHATGTVTGDDYVGGLVGQNWGGTVTNSYATGAVTGYDFAGGLVGWNYYGTVENSYATGAVTGSNAVGGLVGCNYGLFFSSVTKSYSVGAVTGTLDVGGLVGLNNATVSNSFWDTQTSGQAGSAGGTGKSTAEMMDFDTFALALWDIVLIASYVDQTWYIDDGVDYPRLGWQ